jgi:hypothetical protein
MKINFKIGIPIILLLLVAGAGGYYFIQKNNSPESKVVSSPQDLIIKYPKSTLDTDKADRLFKNAEVCDDYEPPIQPDLKKMYKQGKAVVQYTFVENGCIKTGQEIISRAEADARIQVLRSDPNIAAADYATTAAAD